MYFEKYLLMWAQPAIILTYWSRFFLFVCLSTYFTHYFVDATNMPCTKARQKLPNWPLGARTAVSFVSCYLVMLKRSFRGQSSEFCSRNPTLCFASQWVFARVSNWGAMRWVRFCFRLGKTASEMLEILRKLSQTKPMLVHAHLCGFLDSHLGKLQLKIVIVRTSLHGSYRAKCDGSYQNVHRRPMKYNFGDGCTWGDFRDVCASVAHRWAEAAAIFDN